MDHPHRRRPLRASTSGVTPALAVSCGERFASERLPLSGIAGSLLTRYGWVLAGHASARNWRLPLEIPDTETAKTKPIGEETLQKLTEKIG